MINYASGDGNDTIFGFNSDDTLNITNGYYSTEIINSDVIVTVENGSICLKDAADKNISIKNSNISGLLTENNLSEIVENNLSLADDPFEKQNFDALIQKDLMFAQNYSESVFDGKLSI